MFYAHIHALLNFEYREAVGGIGQDLATEVTNLGLNQPPVYIPV